MDTLVEVVQRERISEPVIITPQIDDLLSEVANFRDGAFHSFEIGTKHMERKSPVDSQILQELYARRILSALYYENLSHPRAGKISAKFSYGRAANSSRKLLEIASDGDGRPNWSLRTLIPESRAVVLAKEEGDEATIFFSSLYGAEQGLNLMFYLSKRGIDSIAGWDYKKLDAVVRVFLEDLKALSERIPHNWNARFSYRGVLSRAKRLDILQT